MWLRVVSIALCLTLGWCFQSRAAEPTASERAVALSAGWLAEHQLADGGWNFKHTAAEKCGGKCESAGSLVEARNAATGLAILALISAGQAEKEARYAKELRAGLTFLTGQLKERPKTVGKTHTFEETGGTMYSHGIATLALCEGFRATGESALREPVQKALDHIVYAQDPAGGGWRYTPRQPGDTCISGWQISALASGHDPMLVVPAETFRKAGLFLDSMQAAEGARYGYTFPGAAPGTTASGLLSRRRLGWKAEHPAFRSGVEYLSALGPQKSNVYFNLFATGAIRQADEDSWKSWQAKLVPMLVESQAKEGHAAGSWSIPGDHGSACGGRHYCTTFAAITLGVEQGKLATWKK